MRSVNRKFRGFDSFKIFKTPLLVTKKPSEFQGSGRVILGHPVG